MTFLVILLCVLIAGFYGGCETGAYRLNRIRLRGDAQSGRRLARLTERVVGDMERFVCAALVAQNLAFYVATVVCTELVVEHVRGELAAEFISTLVLAPVMLVVADVIPKSIFQVLADPLMRWASPLLWLTERLLSPFIPLLLGMVAFWRRILGGRAAPREAVVSAQYLNSLLSAGTQEGIITRQQDVILRNILELRGRPLREIMTPLSRVQMLPAALDAARARREIARFTHARLPVYEDSPAKVVGILRVLDFLCEEGEGRPVRECLHEPLFLDAATGADVAFRRLQETGQTMAVVVDPQRRAVGVLTMDDLLQGLFSTLGAY